MYKSTTVSAPKFRLDVAISQCVSDSMYDFKKSLEKCGIEISEKSFHRLIDEISDKIKVSIE